jgi:hypothetical protein
VLVVAKWHFPIDGTSRREQKDMQWTWEFEKSTHGLACKEQDEQHVSPQLWLAEGLVCKTVVCTGLGGSVGGLPGQGQRQNHKPDARGQWPHAKTTVALLFRQVFR